MKRMIVFILLFLSGCIGVESGPKDLGVEHRLDKELNLTQIALSPEDLGFIGWVPSSENLTTDFYERRFVRVEPSFGSASRLTNRVHLYLDSESAMADYTGVAEHLESQIQTSGPVVGDAAIMWAKGTQGYLLFIRGRTLVEFEYQAADTFEPEFLVEIAQKVDSRIKGNG
jgi:hypothetical protein